MSKPEVKWFKVPRKTVLTVIVCCLILIALAASSPVRPSIKNRFLSLPLGTYAFRMYNSQGVKVADGELTIFERETATMIRYERLKCHLRWRGFERNNDGQAIIGSEEKEFDLTGILENGKMKFDLNSGLFDSNNILEGKFESGIIKGKWDFCGFAGCTPQGTFEAIRK